MLTLTWVPPRAVERSVSDPATDSARSRLKEGLGLGIPIARLLLEGQDARLTIETAEGSGTTASVRFLLAQRAGDAVDLKSAQS